MYEVQQYSSSTSALKSTAVTVVERSQHTYVRRKIYIQYVYCTSMHSTQVLCAYSLHSHIAKLLYPAVCTHHDSSLGTMAPTGCCVASAQQLIMLPCRMFTAALASAAPCFAPFFFADQIFSGTDDPPPPAAPPGAAIDCDSPVRRRASTFSCICCWWSSVVRMPLDNKPAKRSMCDQNCSSTTLLAIACFFMDSLWLFWSFKKPASIHLDNLSRLPIDASESGVCVSACCCTAAVVHPHDPMTKGRVESRKSQSPVHCGTPLPDVDTFRGTGRCRISQLYRYVCTVQTGGHFLLPRPTTCIAVSYHREHDIDRFLATPFLIVLLLLSAISDGSFLNLSKI